MPTFRVKNLSVTLPEVGERVQYCTLGYTRLYTPCCGDWYSGKVCFNRTTDPCGRWSPYVQDEPLTPVINPADEVATLELARTQLERALKAVEARGIELEQAMRPQTLEQAEALEQQLAEALKEVQAMKGKFK
jgi:hypothetical protein